MSDGFSAGSRLPDQPLEPVSRRSSIVFVTLLVVVLLAVAAGVAWYVIGLDDEPTDPAPTGEAVSDELERFYTQELDWTDCGTARCTEITVPVDYDEPEGDTLQLAVKSYQADGEGIGSIVVNPGGPGASAVDYAGQVVGLFSDEVTDAYDVVGVDPRGIGRSTPLECLDDAAMDAFVATDPDPDDAGEIIDVREAIEQMGTACAENSGDLAEHVSTAEAARDMDIVRALLGRQKLDWFGASYGTQLGATYADLFPENVGRMILDGAVDPSLDQFDSALGQTTGFQRAFDAFAQYCIDQGACPLGSSVDEARGTVVDLLDRLDSDPLPVGDRELARGNAFFGIALPLYAEQLWDVLQQALTLALNGEGAALLQLSDFYFEREANGEYQGGVGQTIYAVNCLDAAANPTLEEVQDRLPEFRDASPVFGEALGWGVLACTDWPLSSDTPQADVTAEGAPPILVIGTTRDPATPYEWAPALADQLSSGVLVTREGDGHTAFSSGNQCIADIVNAFYADGTVPEDGVTCPEE